MSYSENALVEQPTIALFAELGWRMVSVMEEVFGPSGTLGRETSGDLGAERAGRCRCAGEAGNGGQVVQAGRQWKIRQRTAQSRGNAP